MFEIARGGEEEVKLKLKEFLEQDKDFNRYYSWLRDYDTIRLIGRREYLLSIDAEEAREYIRSMNRSPNDCFLKIFYDRSFIGTLKIGHINWENRIADMGIMIGSHEFRGKGASVQAMRAGMSYAFDKLGMRRLTGGCASENVPMQKCFERCGFTREGCSRQSLFLEGKWQDHYQYGILKEEFSKEEA